jgi:ATP/maltotriose-dependent transcriptional regulator MalT
VVGLAEAGRGDVAAACEHVTQAAAIVDALANRDLAGQLVAVFYLSAAEAQLGRHREALSHGERGLLIARATGQTLLLVPLMVMVGWAQFWLGDLAAATQTADRSLEAARSLGIDQCLAWAWTLVALINIHHGDPAYAVAAAEHAVAHAHAVPRGLFGCLSHCTLGEAQLAAGRPQHARKQILECGGGPGLERIEAVSRPRWYGVLAQADLALGDVDQAEQWVDRAAAVVDPGELPVHYAATERVRAITLLAAGDGGEAAVSAERAAKLFGDHGLSVEAARALTVAGRAQAADGRQEAAVQTLEAAYAQHQAQGATRWRDEAARELRRLSQRVPREGRRGDITSDNAIETLSGREREVANLVAQGRTNKQIGAALYLSERTIENHVSHIFRKLDITSRAEIAREIARATEADAIGS